MSAVQTLKENHQDVYYIMFFIKFYFLESVLMFGLISLDKKLYLLQNNYLPIQSCTFHFTYANNCPNNCVSQSLC